MGNLFSRLFDGKKSLIFLGILFIFSLLIFKDPFSERTLIPNFEPYPDTFYYLNPALNLAKGMGFNISREGRSFVSNAPPLYSLSLVPIFIVKPDPRMAYYVNVVLAIISFGLFYVILRKLFQNTLIVYFTLILFATNYFIYWVPTLIMAENLSLTVFLASLFFLLLNVSKFNVLIIAVLVVGNYATKYANIPLSASIVFLYLLKIFLAKNTKKQKIILLSLFIISLILCYLPLAFFEQITKGMNIIYQAFSIFLKSNKKIVETSSQEAVSSNPWFGVQYLGKNLPLYFDSLLGNPNRFLWDNTPLVPKLAAWAGGLGILVSIFNKKFRFLSIGLIIFIVTSIAFMSTFYTFDARYVYIFIPILLIGLGLFFTKLENISNVFTKKMFNYLVILAILIYLLTSFLRIKNQISLNLRHSETPWWYVSVLKLNEYFTDDKIINGKKPVVISAIPPFLVDYYSNGNYILLPLSYEQEFRNFKELVWGPNDYSNLPRLYTKYLNEGFNLYVSRYGLGNESYTNRDFNIIVEEFDTILVLPGCFDQCNIYSVKLKEKNGK